MSKVYITVFNENKSITEWSKDERCKVEYYTLQKRIKNKWEPEKALTYISPKVNKDYLIGKIFGRLIVISLSGKGKRGQKIWLCKCECGNNKEVLTSRLVNRTTSSCGCYRRELGAKRFKDNYLGLGIAAQNALFSNYQREAKQRKLEWNLDKDTFLSLTKQNCYYCGCEPSQLIKRNNLDDYTYNGIDRIDSSLGYIKNNVVSCCQQCNIMKFDYSMKEFLDRIKLIYNKHIK